VVARLSTSAPPASAKIRADDDEDCLLPIYAERLPVHTMLGAPEPCSRLRPGVERPETLVGYRANRRLEDALLDAYEISYPEGLTCADELACRNEKSRDEPLQSKPGSKPLHHPLSLSDGKIRIHRPTVGSLMGAVFDLRHYLAPGGGI
jgi:hypothetical protein